MGYKILSLFPGTQHSVKQKINTTYLLSNVSCAEFGISPNADFRFTRGDNHGLGSVFEYFSYSGYTKTPFKYPSKETKFADEGGRASDGNLVPYIENTEARNQYEYFLCPVSHGLTSAGLSRINQSIESVLLCDLGLPSGRSFFHFWVARFSH